MERQQRHFLNPRLLCIEESQNAIDAILIVVESWNDRNADNQPCMRLCKPPEVFGEDAEIPFHHLLEFLSVSGLHIEQDDIGMADNFLRLPFIEPDGTRCVEARLDVPALTFFQAFDEEIRLHERFTSRESDTTPRLVIENGIAVHLVDQLDDINSIAHLLQVIERLVAQLALDRHLFLLHALTLRIMAPRTPHGASLEEHRGSDSRSVVDRISLDIENKTFHGLQRY